MRLPDSLKRFFALLKENHIVIALASFLWLLYKTGQKPSRITYPCQQAALANIGILVYALPAFYINKIKNLLKNKQEFVKKIAMVLVLFMLILSAESVIKNISDQAKIRYNEINKPGTIGLLTGAAVTGYMTLPHAMALESPHRVISVRNPNATEYIGGYYGSNSNINQTVVDAMFDEGMMQLTQTNNIYNAWKAILPDYQPGEKVAIKVNMNSGTSSYDSTSSNVDGLAQTMNPIIRGLKIRGIPEEDIWIYDAGRYLPDRFRVLIEYDNIKIFDHYGTASDDRIRNASFDSDDPYATVDFNGSDYPGTHKLTDVLINATYLINVPIMRSHGGAWITLSLKNHYGTIDGLYTGSHSIHDYTYPSSGDYSSTANPIVDINNNPHIKNKTVLIVGDGLYGGWRDNNDPVTTWNSFSGDSPNMLLFGVDPVAIDSVMFDWLKREGRGDSLNAGADDVLEVAANSGLGIYDQWDNNDDRNYSTIDYVEIDHDAGRCKHCYVVPSYFPSYDNFVNENSTDFFSFNETEIQNVTNATLETPGKAKIKFTSAVNFSGIDLDDVIVVRDNYVFVDSSAETTLDVTAEITFYNITHTNPTLYKDGSECGDCSLLSHEGTTVSFSVSGFSNYTVIDSGSGNHSLEIFDSVELLTGVVNKTVTFYANYSNESSLITGATCNLSLDDGSSYIMDEGLDNYNYSLNYSSSGLKSWNVSCNKTGYTTLNLSDSLRVIDCGDTVDFDVNLSEDMYC
ncbi:MAG: DUF362 domain-containing protein, partial [Candidatus Woesearchaeota archaeon]